MQSNYLTVGEHVSALADGALSGEEFTAAMQAVLSDPQAMHSWHTYHLVGDVLRGQTQGMSAQGGIEFWQRLESRLEIEPVCSGAHLPSANEAVFRWRLLASVACLGLAGVIGWGVWSQTSPPQSEQFSAVPLHPLEVQTSVTANALPGVILRDPALDDLLAQHQRLGGHSVLQIPTGFLRNATYEVPAK